jgi:chemotaxis protein MotA
MNIEQMSELLHAKKDTVVSKYFEDAKLLGSIAKFPPALGLLGASTGMIEMMQKVGGVGGVSEIGQSMAVALVATFWGIGVANFIILPLGDFATRQADESLYMREMIIDVVYMIRKNYDLPLIINHLASRVKLEDRSKLRDYAKIMLADFLKPKSVSDNIEVGALVEYSELQYVKHRKRN